MGPSAFTENQFKDNMLEVEMARDESPLVFDQSRGEKYALVQAYREAVGKLCSHHVTNVDQAVVQWHTRPIHRRRDTKLPGPTQCPEPQQLYRRRRQARSC